jgi:hypothetical protein
MNDILIVLNWVDLFELNYSRVEDSLSLDNQKDWEVKINCLVDTAS